MQLTANDSTWEYLSALTRGPVSTCSTMVNPSNWPGLSFACPMQTSGMLLHWERSDRHHGTCIDHVRLK